MQIEIIETPTLGNRGYLIHDGAQAVAVDVQRDYGRWIDVAKKANVTITHVFETHMHNDYVTGGYRLAQKIHAKYVIPADSGEHFEATIAHDSDEFIVGGLTITALHTPGHTAHHMSYAVADGNRSIVCTGGGLLYGTVGRTDLISKDQTQILTSLQYDSAHKLLDKLPGDAAVYPTHGFGSFCSSSDGSGASSSTLNSEKQINIAFTHDKESFIASILEGLGSYPRYYAHMGSLNQSGPGDIRQLHIHEYAVEDIANALLSDHSWVVDVRSRKAFAAQHPEAAVGIELGNSFATYTGWILPWADDITLVGESEQDIRTAHEELSRIGMDAFVSGATHSLDSYFSAAPLKQYDVKKFADLNESYTQTGEPFVLDVRLPNDWQTAHVTGSVNIPLHEVMERVDTLPNDTPIWVHCASGYRASIAASLIERSGRLPILIDDSFENAVDIHLTSSN